MRLKPDDEVTRIAAENLSLRFPEKSDSYRRRFARDHLGFGESFAARNHLGKALLEFRRSILLDDELVGECQKLTGIETRRALIDYALREVRRHGRQRRLLELKGAVEWEGDLAEWRKARV